MTGFEGLPAGVRRGITGALAVRFPQAVLLEGPEERTLALGWAIAEALECERPRDGLPCGECEACRKVRHRLHPDVIALEKEGEIKVDDARRIRAEASVLPNEGARKVFLIAGAGRMNPTAQNALLKVLEEPPAYCFFLLLTDQPERILETILSRCTRYRLPPEEQPPDESLLPLLTPYLRALAGGRELGLMQAALAVEKLARPQVRAWLALLQTALRDAVFAAGNLGAPLLPAAAAETRALAAKLTVRRLTALYDLCGRLSLRAEGNAAASAMTCALTADVYTLAYPGGGPKA